MENLNPEDLHHLVEDSFLGGFDDLDGLVPPANNNDANRKTLIQLNERLVKYLENVKSLKKENQNLQTKINELEGRDHHGGDWYQTQILLERIENITKENAEKLLQIKTIKLEKEELNRKLEEETKGEKKLEKELKDLEKNTRLQKQQQENLNEEIEQLKEKFQQQQCNHQTNVKELCEKIKETKVTVEIDSEKSNLAELVRNIRKKYAEIANTNTDEMNNWYKKKLESIQNEEAHNLLELKSAKSKCMQLLRQKKILEIGINALNTTIKSLEKTQEETRHRVSGFKDETDDLKKMLEALIKQIKEQYLKNLKLFNVTESLKEQIDKYQSLVESNKGPDSDQSPLKTTKLTSDEEDSNDE